MAEPSLHYRGDIIVMVAFEPDTPLVYTNFCGATGIDLTIDNAIQETLVGDCQDWSLPIKTIAAYGAQTVTATINAQLARQNRDRLLLWAKDQMEIPVRFHFVNAEAGQTEYMDGVGMLPSLGLSGIGNDQGSVITTTLNLRFKNGLEFTAAT
ncbi:hypothetical protein [uncultured Paracoccus sp.]|uniref:hypothetical protein n=1 Tax=uncultured Paracoccus sp. TaxID=189685 RepID=UPI0025F53E95|nr:hypothetical protein [uncultured Paracoccus sp.]